MAQADKSLLYCCVPGAVTASVRLLSRILRGFAPLATVAGLRTSEARTGSC